MPELPTCDCVKGMPPYDRLTAIYQAAAELSGDTSLPDSLCVAGVSPFERFAYIYAAFRVLADDSSLPSQECVEGESKSDQVARIYQAAALYAGDSSLQSWLCVRGLPIWSQWVEIYKALYSASGESDELVSPLCVSPQFDVLSQVYCASIWLIENANPIVLSAEVLESGISFQITFNQDVVGHDGFSFTVNGNPANIAYSSGDGTDTLIFDTDTPIVQGDVVLLTYSPGNVVSDATGNPLGAFADFPVTNPFDVFSYFRPGGVFTYFRPDGTSIYIRP